MTVWSESSHKLPLHQEQGTELKGVREISRMLIKVVSILRIFCYLNIYIHRLPDIYGTNYNEFKPRPTFEKLINCEDYPVKYPDRSGTVTSESPLLTQFDGIGVMELQEQEQREIAERHKEDMIRQMAAATGQSAQILRAMHRRRFNAPPMSLTVNRSDDLSEYA